MSPIRVLVVADGVTTPDDESNFARHGISYFPRVVDPTQTTSPQADDQFTLSEFLSILTHSTTYFPGSPPIVVDTAHRRANAAQPPNLNNFNFATSTDLAVYDEIWLFGYEGLNDDTQAYDGFTPLTAAEVAAIANFMATGGGVFATGDHSGLGSYMCGQIPRVRSMRKWFDVNAQSDINYPNASTLFSDQNYPTQWYSWSGGGADRADTTVQAVDGWHFDNQSDDRPQRLTGLTAHPILQDVIHQDSTGQFVEFPDHMHEGEVITPWSDPSVTPASIPSYIDEYPFTERPIIIATGTVQPNHVTTVDQGVPGVGGGMSCENSNFAADGSKTNGKTINVLATYDGHKAAVGRIVTDSSFHHYIDLNLIGDPCSAVGPKTMGFSTPSGQPVLNDLQTFYINTAIWLAKPTKAVSFIIERSTFGADEITARRKQPRKAAGGLPIQDAFRVVVDGFTAAQLGLTDPTSTLASPPVFSQPVNGITILPSSIAPNVANTADGGDYGPEFQRFTFHYDLDFPDPADPEFVFPNPTEPVDLNVTVNGIGASGQIELIKQPDPFMLHGDPPWLSIDLRVFTIHANEASKFGPTMGPDALTAPQFIQDVLRKLNEPNSPVIGEFDSLPPDESSKLFLQPQDFVNPQYSGIPVFNFAIARVRYIGLIGTGTSPVRVFFRLFQAQSTTGIYDYPPGAQYRRTSTSPPVPLAGIIGNDYVTIPCFATPRVDSTQVGMDTQPEDTPNKQSFPANPAGTETDRYFGCWLDINQPLKPNSQQPNDVLPLNVPPSNIDGPFNNPAFPPLPIEQAILRNLHQCLIAEIDFDPVTIPKGVDATNWDKLAQRNLAWSDAGSAQAVTTFEIKPTAGTLNNSTTPDELMIDWGNLPAGCAAQIYLPAVKASQILAVASRIYSSHRWTWFDPHTLQCDARGVSYLPIPPGSDVNYAGLLTVAMPDHLRIGQQFAVAVRQITSASAIDNPPPPPVAVARRRPAAPAARQEISWRRVVGAFQLNIPVKPKKTLLLPEEHDLAVLRWINEAIPAGNRWHPTFGRYVDQIAGRVRVFGGDPTTILPSPIGALPGRKPEPRPHPGHEELCFTGKITGLVFDHFGDFDGFILDTEHEEHTFDSTQADVKDLAERVWREHLRITVLATHHHPHRPTSIIIHQPPAHL